jgi:enoyl-CoA hydratase
MSDLVTYSEEEHYCLLQMDDGKANAMGFAMMSELNAALDRAEEAGKVVVIAGRPGKFSAGFDLAVMANQDQDTLRLLRAGAALSRRLLDFATPVVLAVSGHALAMGALLILSADYRIGIQGNYKIGLNEVAIGMTLPWFGVELARSRLSKRHFHKAVNLAQIYDADGATEAGYLDEAVPEDELLPRATALAQQLAGLDLQAHRNTKDRTRQELKLALEEAVEREFAG